MRRYPLDPIKTDRPVVLNILPKYNVIQKQLNSNIQTQNEAINSPNYTHSEISLVFNVKFLTIGSNGSPKVSLFKLFLVYNCFLTNKVIWKKVK